MRRMLRWSGEILATLLLTVIFKGPLAKLSTKLGENAVLGWIDDRIGEAFGLSAPSVSQIVDWGLPLLAAVFVLLLYHWIARRFQHTAPTVSHGEDTFFRATITQTGVRANIIPKPAPRQMIVGGLIIIVLGVILVGYGAWQERGIETSSVKPSAFLSEPFAEKDRSFREELQKFVLSSTTDLNRHFGALLGEFPRDIQNFKSPEREKKQAALNLLNSAIMPFRFAYKPLSEAASKPVEIMNVAEIEQRLKTYFTEYKEAQNSLKQFLEATELDPSIHDSMRVWLNTDDRTLIALHDLKSFHLQAAPLEDLINEGFFPTRSNTFIRYQR